MLRNVFKGEHEGAEEPSKTQHPELTKLFPADSVFKHPGLREDGLDEHVLGAWIDEVRRLGTETDRVAVTDSFIGRLLAHAPPDRDAGWPHKAVRRQIEQIKSEELERGLQLSASTCVVHGKQVLREASKNGRSPRKTRGGRK